MRQCHIIGGTPRWVESEILCRQFITIVHSRNRLYKAHRAFWALEITRVKYATHSFGGIKYDGVTSHVVGGLYRSVPVLGIPAIGLGRHCHWRRPTLILRIKLLLRVVGNAGYTVLIILTGVAVYCLALTILRDRFFLENTAEVFARLRKLLKRRKVKAASEGDTPSSRESAASLAPEPAPHADPEPSPLSPAGAKPPEPLPLSPAGAKPPAYGKAYSWGNTYTGNYARHVYRGRYARSRYAGGYSYRAGKK